MWFSAPRCRPPNLGNICLDDMYAIAAMLMASAHIQFSAIADPESIKETRRRAPEGVPHGLVSRCDPALAGSPLTILLEKFGQPSLMLVPLYLSDCVTVSPNQGGAFQAPQTVLFQLTAIPCPAHPEPFPSWLGSLEISFLIFDVHDYLARTVCFVNFLNPLEDYTKLRQ